MKAFVLNLTLPPVNGIRRVTENEKKMLKKAAEIAGISIVFQHDWLLEMNENEYFNLLVTYTRLEEETL